METPSSFSTTDQSTVALVRVSGRKSLPERLLLGGGFPAAITIGRHEDNELVLPLRSASKVHCQVALRVFRLPGKDDSHEAVFLRDNSRNGTMVNGSEAFRPWHWLQHGDTIGLKDMRKKSENVVDFFKVEYSKHIKLPGHMVSVEEPPRARDVPVKAVAPLAARPSPPRPVRGAFRKEIINRVVDVKYMDMDQPTTYRMRVISFEAKTGWHHVDSAGLDEWDGESFDDTIDLNEMYSLGNITFVEDVEEEEDEDSDEGLAPKKKKRTH